MKKITEVQGQALPLHGNDIDTDRIIPARFLKEITFGRMGEYPFYDERFDSRGNEKEHPFNSYTNASILLANANFGCGSSREHAPQSLMRWGIQAIVAESFAEIFAGNCTMLGVPVLCAAPEDLARAQALAENNPELIFTVSLAGRLLSAESAGFSAPLSIPDSRLRALTEGTWDSTAILLSNTEKTRTLASTLPQIKPV